MWYVWRHERMLSKIVGFDKRAVWRSRSLLDIDQHLTCKVGMHVVSYYAVSPICMQRREQISLSKSFATLW